MSQTKLTGVKGMNDILPPESALWEEFEAAVRRVVGLYGYQSMRAPVVEHTPLFVRGIGEVTDVVEKEMYSFTDKLNGDPLTLRPEFTAGLVRAVVEHNLLYEGGKRIWCMGPVFRHERPQRGRYRQFHQVDVEAFGFAGPDVDAEVIALAARLLRELGITDIELQINSIGQGEERARHRADLIAYFEGHSALLDDEAKRRLHTNPMRILDTKNPAMQAMVAQAPQMLSYLGDESRAHFEGLQALLTRLGFAFTINPRLVRGLDYYNRTVFEFVTTRLGAQGTVCGGGRYDGLIETMGGKPNPGIGWGMGVERVIELMKENRAGQAAAPQARVYVMVQSESLRTEAIALAETLRSGGVPCLLHAGAASLKSQFKKADASGAPFGLVLAEAEWAAGQVVLKHLRADGSAEKAANQQVVARDDVLAALTMAD
jgi:histidyl-tRNA synthetase